MSLGYGGKAIKRCESDDSVYYGYSVYNWNIESCNSNIEDGIIEISKHSLVKAERHEKIVRKNKRKKVQVKLILQNNKIEDLLESGDIQIVNNSQCFIKDEGYDYIALRLCLEILNYYQLHESMPLSECVCF